MSKFVRRLQYLPFPPGAGINHSSQHVLSCLPRFLRLGGMYSVLHEVDGDPEIG